MAQQDRQTKRRPNILFIQTDQQRVDTMAAYGGTVCQTPHLNQLAEESIVFNNAYTSCPVCTPARASMQTGLYPFKHGMQTNGYGLGSIVQELPDTARLLSRQLGEQEYNIGYTGKWHLGTKTDEERHLSANLSYIQFPEIAAGIRTLPTDVGYEGDDFGGHGLGGMVYPEFKQYLQENGLEWKLENKISGHFEGHYAAELTSPEEGTVEYYLVDRAIHHIDRFREREEPFFFSLNFWGPHEPYIAPTRFLNLYRDQALEPWPNFRDDGEGKPSIHRIKMSNTKNWDDFVPYIRHYYAFMSSIDEQIGRLIAYLKEHDLYDDTVIIFTADHGESLGIHGGLCDKSYFMYEETCKIPLVVKPAGQSPSKRRDDRFVGTCDIHATILGLAGVEMMPQGADGRSFAPVLDGHELTDWPDSVVTEGAGLEGVMYTQRMIRKGHYKYVFNCGDLDELYDLSKDRHELDNRISDPEYGSILSEMRQALADWMVLHEDGALKQYKRLRMSSQ
ncbi:sulfatase-like hydrolase/transferase [Paenibacillus mendelii]|uniref:Sulfatase-like hydrolase/transferase n=1 Tax=Paenibacillus mendelii TaxID=206163 RepID=A0ABV6J7Z5_9BACL|nr:sulfatase-like hydrolase/transferase [Paenibacillus mendelii]MCQ6561440.1 sulfatase-like hydrolase/transferase [Paenibacillus mendelii]